jgi:two-component system OmpR family sensor kinase
MNPHSIFFKLNILFVIALLATILAGMMTVIQIEKRHQTDLLIKSRLVIHTWRSEHSKPTKLIDELGLVEVKRPWKSILLPKSKKHFKNSVKKRPQAHRLRIGATEIISMRNYLYLWIRTRQFKILLREKQSRKERLLMPIVFFGGIVLLLGAIYWFLRRSLLPIRQLDEDIRRFGEGKMPDREFFSQDHDEIAQVGNAFYASAHRIQQLTRSRQLFVRNIFHELNTPVTKGKILTELVDDPRTKNMLESIFGRFSSLLKELAQMEKITSQDVELRMRKIRIIELIDQARDLLYIDESIRINITDETMTADFSMMSIVFKNLIDNARKYGTNLYIRHKDTDIEFISTGEALEHPLGYYLEPFASDEARSHEGFGLGLYIVHEILKKHNLKLTYRHQDGKNIFSIANM